MEYTSEIEIKKPIRDVFDMLAALDKFDDWFPTNSVYLGMDLTSPLPVTKGTTYDLRSAQGVRKGVVEVFDRPHRILFLEKMSLPFGGELRISIEYLLVEKGEVTQLKRIQKIDAPSLIAPMIKTQEPMINSGIDAGMKVIKEKSEL